MPGEVAFAVEGKPVAQGSHIAVRGRVVPVNSTALKKWRRTLSEAASASIPDGWDSGSAVQVEATFHMQRPKHHYGRAGTLKPGAPALPTGRPDIDKLARAVGDSLTDSHVLGDDSQIVCWIIRKQYADMWGASVKVRKVQTR